MEVEEYRNCTVLFVDKEFNVDSAKGKALQELACELKKLGFSVLNASNTEEAEMLLRYNSSISCTLLDHKQDFFRLCKLIRELNPKMPIFIIVEKINVERIPKEAYEETKGYFLPLEDTADFMAGRVKDAVDDYLDEVLPPFFMALIDYTYDYKYAWHTPGHMGGIAFRKGPAGRFFYDFFGENMLRADLSVSVPELGSLLEHTGVIGKAEALAARIFGADKTYFVTNGTSTANKIVFHGCVTPGDIVLVDRNCHKSSMHAIIMTGAIPVYFLPTRNSYGIIGPIHNSEFEPAAIRRKIQESPLIQDKNAKPRLAIITNSTYDGLCYNASAIRGKLKNVVENLLFDEAWYGYAAFHPLYAGRFGMCGGDYSTGPNVFSTQSTHKVLAALSQGSMVHAKAGKPGINHERFNEAFMMHTSTSPQYVLIASLDVGAKMMEGEAGTRLVEDSILEAIEFRKRIVSAKKDMKKGDWWFSVWQPEKTKGKAFYSISDDVLKKDPNCWTLKANEKWHGFGDFEEEHVMLDPIKVTVLTPGIMENGSMDAWGIPACVVSAFLRKEGIVVEKTGHYSFLCLFTIGTTRGKAGVLLNMLYRFKELYDRNAPLEDVLPHIVKFAPSKYVGMGLKQLCDTMHAYFKARNVTKVLTAVYEKLPQQALRPADTYAALVRGNVEKLSLKDITNRVSAAMIVPYPPGIPVIMPGEKFSHDTKAILDYLKICEDFDNEFPGFENEIHGVSVEQEDGAKHYKVYCVKL